jgi:hypothetical protein
MALMHCCCVPPGAEPRFGVCGAELWRAQQPVHQPARAQRQSAAKGEVPTQAHIRCATAAAAAAAAAAAGVAV